MASPTLAADLAVGKKTCSKCGETKPLDNFQWLSRDKAFRAKCRQCDRAYARAYHHANREKQIERLAKYKEKNRYSLLVKQREYNERNRELKRAYDKAHTKEKSARWQRAKLQEGFREKRRAQARARYKADPEKHIEYVLRRRARELNAPIVERIDRLIVADRDGWKCHICGKKVTRSNWSIDHLTPLVHGGDHTYTNISLAHVNCNRRRGAGRIPAQLRLI